MPKIDDLSARKTFKKFKKSNYRPWNYMDEVEKETVSELNTSAINNNAVLGSFNCNQGFSRDLDVKRQQLDSRKTDNPEIQLEKTSNVETSVETTLDKIFCLTGHQKTIFIFIIERCISRGVLATGIVKMEALCEITGTSFKMVKLSIKRLIAKKLISRNEGKKGRGGFHSFRVNEIIRNAFLEYRRMVINDKNDTDKLQVNTNQFLHHNKKNAIQEELPEDWKNINIDFLKHIGFSENHLRQLYYKKLNIPEIIEESIKHFSFALINNPKVKKYDDPLNVLMGVLRKGQAWIESNYRSPQEIAQRELLERKKMETERLIEFSKEVYEIEFKHWQMGLSTEEIESIVPSKVNLVDKAEAIIPKKIRLKMFFEKNIWPDKKKEYFVDKEVITIK